MHLLDAYIGLKLLLNCSDPSCRQHRLHSVDISLRENKPKIKIQAQSIRRTMCNFLLSKWRYRFVSLDPFTFTDICHMNITQTLQIESFQCTERPVLSNRMKGCQQNKSHRIWSEYTCLEYNSVQTNYQYFFLTHFFNLTDAQSLVADQTYRFWSKAQISWRKAQKKCNTIGASLIYFLSKADLHDILQFVKFMRRQSAMLSDPEALYIGLKFEVCTLVFTNYVYAFLPMTLVK